MITTEEHKAYAMEIINQLGGPHFIMMTGAQYISYDSTAENPNVAFKIRGSRKVTHVKIVLDPLDTYTVEFIKIHGNTMKTVNIETGIYNDMLQDIFTKNTGLNTSLGTMGR